MNVNLVLSILLLVITEICFGLNFDNAQLCFVRFLGGYFLSKRRPLQVYVEINDCIFMLKNGRNNKPNAKLRNFKKFFFGKKFKNRERLSTKGRN